MLLQKAHKMSDSGNRKNENDEAAMLQAQIDALPDFDEQVTRAFLALNWQNSIAFATQNHHA